MANTLAGRTRRSTQDTALKATGPMKQAPKSPSSAAPYVPDQYARQQPVNQVGGVRANTFSRTPEHQAAYDRVLTGRSDDNFRQYERSQDERMRAAIDSGIQRRQTQPPMLGSTPQQEAQMEQFWANHRGRPSAMPAYEPPPESNLPPPPPYVPIGGRSQYGTQSREYLDQQSPPSGVQPFRSPPLERGPALLRPSDVGMGQPTVQSGPPGSPPLPPNVTTQPPAYQNQVPDSIIPRYETRLPQHVTTQQPQGSSPPMFRPGETPEGVFGADSQRQDTATGLSQGNSGLGNFYERIEAIAARKGVRPGYLLGWSDEMYAARKASAPQRRAAIEERTRQHYKNLLGPYLPATLRTEPPRNFDEWTQTAKR